MTIQESGTIILSYNPDERENAAEWVNYLRARGYWVDDMGKDFYLLKLEKETDLEKPILDKSFLLRWDKK
jgi:hypothetical protein